MSTFRVGVCSTGGQVSLELGANMFLAPSVFGYTQPGGGGGGGRGHLWPLHTYININIYLGFYM